MDVKQLRYFLAVADNKSIARAAEKIYMSQQGLSMAILRLESELSCRLLERTRAGMVLTPEGEYLLPRARQIVSEFDELEQHLRDPNSHHPTIKIACSLGAISEFFAPALFDFREHVPQYTLSITETSDMECDRMVENRVAEIGLGVAPLDQVQFTFTPIFSSPFCLLVHRTNPIAELKSVTVDFLQSTPIMVMNEESKTRKIVVDCCEKRGFQPIIQWSAAEVIAIHRMVAKNCGVGISVLSVAEDLNNPEVVAIPFEEKEMKWELNLFKVKDAELSAGAKTLYSFLLQLADDEKTKPEP